MKITGSIIFIFFHSVQNIASTGRHFLEILHKSEDSLVTILPRSSYKLHLFQARLRFIHIIAGLSAYILCPIDNNMYIVFFCSYQLSSLFKYILSIHTDRFEPENIVSDNVRIMLYWNEMDLLLALE